MTDSAKLTSAKQSRNGRGRIDLDGGTFEAQFNPAFNWCLIKMASREDSMPQAMKDAGLVEITSVNQQSRNKDGTVVKMGPHDCTPDYEISHLPDFQVGDRVYYNAWAGQETPCPEGYLMVQSSYLEAQLTADEKISWI